MRTEEALDIMCDWRPPETMPENVQTAITVLIGAADFYVRGITRRENCVAAKHPQIFSCKHPEHPSYEPEVTS